MEGVIRSFLSYLRVEKGVSMNTHDAYRRDVEKFQEFAAKKRLRLEQATRETIVDFLRRTFRALLVLRRCVREDRRTYHLAKRPVPMGLHLTLC